PVGTDAGRGRDGRLTQDSGPVGWGLIPSRSRPGSIRAATDAAGLKAETSTCGQATRSMRKI
ncbi:MAG: hypothetical protein WAU13_09875, partial [Albidovulum sp.]